MKSTSYSVLFMRDDADVRTLRVSPRRLRLLLWLAGAVAVLVLVGLIVGLRSLVGYRSLLSERRELEVKLADAQVSLERLGNLDKIQRGGAEPAAKPAAKAEAAPQAGVRAFAKINTGALSVDNFRAQLSGKTISFSFDLNVRSGGPANGEVHVLLLRSDGSLTELSPENPADLAFQAQRVKRISSSARAPEGLSRREALGLRVEIQNADREVILGETYALGS